MKAREFLLKLKEEKGFSYERMGKATGTSDAFWHLLIRRDDLPSLERANQICGAMKLTEDQTRTFVNMVFRERLIRYLEKEVTEGDGKTPQIRTLVDLFNSWGPQDREKSIYYVNLPLYLGSENAYFTKEMESLLQDVLKNPCETLAFSDIARASPVAH